MEARVHDDPFGAQPWGNLDVGLEVMLDGVGDIGRYFIGRGRLSIGDVGFRGGNARKRGHWQSCSAPDGRSWRFQDAASNRSIVQEAGVSVA